MLNIEKLRKEFEQEMSLTQKFWIPKLGENIIRILPPSPRSSDDLFYRRVFVHYLENGVVFCLSVYGESCPICNLVEKLRRSKVVEAIALIRRYARVERFLMNIWDFEKSALKQWLAPKTVRLAIVKIILDKDWGDVTDLKTGRNIVIEKMDRGNGIVYEVRPKPSISAFDLLEESEIPTFDEILQRNKKSIDDLLMMIDFTEDEDITGFIERKLETVKGVRSVIERSSGEGVEEVKRAENEVKAKQETNSVLESEEVKQLMEKVLSILKK